MMKLQNLIKGNYKAVKVEDMHNGGHEVFAGVTMDDVYATIEEGMFPQFSVERVKDYPNQDAQVIATILAVNYHFMKEGTYNL